MKQELLDFFMDTAIRAGQLSKAKRLQVGAVAVKNGNIISFSWNGTPRGFDNTCEIEDENGNLITRPEVVHSEENLICKIAQSNESSIGASIFISHAPCIKCAILIYQAGITEVYYKNEYRCTKGLTFLQNSGIMVKRLD